MAKYGRVKTARLTMEIINQETGEILKVNCAPDELLLVTKTINTLNSDGQFIIDRIYAYGEMQNLQKTNKTTMEYRPLEEKEGE